MLQNLPKPLKILQCCQTAAVPFNTYPVTYSNQLMAAGLVNLIYDF